MYTVFFHVIQVLGRTTPKRHLETAEFPDKASSKMVLSPLKEKKMLLMIQDAQGNRIYLYSHDTSLSNEWFINTFHGSILNWGSKVRNNFSVPVVSSSFLKTLFPSMS